MNNLKEFLGDNMSIGTPFSHCPICWDHYSVCRCTEEDKRQYEKQLIKEKEEFLKPIKPTDKIQNILNRELENYAKYQI